MESKILAFVRESLNKKKGYWPEISRETGVTYETITKIAQGRRPNPGIETVEKLLIYFSQKN